MIEKIKAKIRERRENQKYPSFTPETYLNSLDVKSRENVQFVVGFFESLQDQLGDIRIAVIAVGSSTRRHNQRYHPVEDIDLRILNSAEVNTEQRRQIIDTISFFTRDFLVRNNLEFEEHDCTIKTTMLKQVIHNGLFGKNEVQIAPYLDWYNNDPSFEVIFPIGLPIHISISGVDNYPVHEYLFREEKNKLGAVVLLSPLPLQR